jgi:hypothetical protein
MTVTVPATEKTGAAAKAAQITALQAVPTTAAHYQYSQQLLLQTQIELINALVAQGRLNAASILSTVSYRGTLPILTQISALQTQAANWASTNPVASGTLLNVTIPALQAQAVSELLASGQLNAGTVLSTMSYVGGAAQ